MAYDKYDIDYHLTPRGWIKGTSEFFGVTDGSPEIPPDDRVLTEHLSVRQSSGYSDAHDSWRETWRSGSISDDELRALKKKFPRPE